MHWWADNTVLLGKLVLSSYKLFILFFGQTCGILVLWPGIEPMPFAVEVWCLNHWTTREITWMVQLILSVWISDDAICEKGKFAWSGVLINMPSLSICWAWTWAWQMERRHFVHLSLVKLARCGINCPPSPSQRHKSREEWFFCSRRVWIYYYILLINVIPYSYQYLMNME